MPQKKGLSKSFSRTLSLIDGIDNVATQDVRQKLKNGESPSSARDARAGKVPGPIRQTECAFGKCLEVPRYPSFSQMSARLSCNVLLVSNRVAIDGIHHEFETSKFFTNYPQAYMTLLINVVCLRAVSPVLPK
jgi:hypothetical protein